MAYFSDLRQYVSMLEERGKLYRFKQEVVKETEMAPLMLLQYRGLSEDQRKVFLFEHVVGVTGRKYNQSVLLGSPSSREILAMGLMCRPEEIKERWLHACAHPIEPEMVSTGPVHEVVVEERELDNLGLEGLAAPVEAPGFSGSVRTSTQVVTKDPETGIRNVGDYSGHFAGRTEMRLAIAPVHHGAIHHVKWRKLGKAMPVAIVIGATPNVAFTSVAPLPYGMDEFSVAGGIVGEAVKLTKCRTVDLEAPATAEIVIEGEMTEEMEQHAAFADYPGYLGDVGNRYTAVMRVTCITHRRDPIFVAFEMGYPPTTATVLETEAFEAALYQHLKQALHMPGVRDVACHYSGGVRNYIVVQIKKSAPWDAFQALNALAGYEASVGKVSIVVDEDINPRDPDAVNWALSYRMQPHRDVRIITHRSPILDISAYPPFSTNEQRHFPSPVGASAMLIDATRKWDYAPVGLPKKEYMEQAIGIWEKTDLPKLNLRAPWYGYHLGHWREEDEDNARLIVSGDYLKLWEKLRQKRKPLKDPFESPSSR